MTIYSKGIYLFIYLFIYHFFIKETAQKSVLLLDVSVGIPLFIH